MPGLSYTVMRDVVLEVQRTGGSSVLFAAPTLGVTTGYIVGHGQRGLVMDDLPGYSYLAHVSGNFEHMGYEGLGVWGYHGRYYVAPIIHVLSSTEALCMGALWGEWAIWDCAREVPIWCTTVSPTE